MKHKSLIASIYTLVFILSCTQFPTAVGLRSPASSLISGGSCFVGVEKLLNSNKIKQFKRKYHHFSDFGRSSNRRFIKLLKNEFAEENVFYFHIENQFLKFLNDKLFKDKQITYGLTVMYQEIFYRELKNDEVLSSLLISKYADYKGLRFAFNSDSYFEEERIIRYLNQLYIKSIEEFEKRVKTYPFHTYLETAPEEIQNLKRWFIPGVGRSADRAAAASRVGRSISFKQIPHFQKNKTKLEASLKKIAELHEKIKYHFLEHAEKGILSPSFTEEGEYVLSIEVIDLIRKVSIGPSDYFSSFNRSVQQYFGVSLTKEEFDLLNEYVRTVDIFSPSVLQDDTTPLDLGKAIRGLISADISQKGAEGQYQSMSRLIGVSDPTLALEKTREGYWLVDKSLKDAKDWFLTAINYTGPPDNLTHVYHSGDDILFFPKEQLTRAEKISLVSKLAGYKDPSEFRLVFLPSKFKDNQITIPENLMSQMVVDAENLEKALRRRLKSIIGIKAAKQLGVAINVNPKTDKRFYEIMIASKEPILRKKIRMIISSLQKENPDLETIKILFLSN